MGGGCLGVATPAPGGGAADEDGDDVGSGALAHASDAPTNGPCAVSAHAALPKGARARRSARAARKGRAWYHDLVRFNARARYRGAILLVACAAIGTGCS